MPSALIIGSGAGAAGAALALSRRSDLAITVLDLGLRLEESRAQVVDHLARTDRADWNVDELSLIAAPSVVTHDRALPEKRVYGSDFPFRDVGQLARTAPLAGVNKSLISAAYGGFSNVWGAQLMPFSKATLRSWPISYDELEPHYRSVLESVPLAAADDDLAERFPLIRPTSGLPPESARTTRVLAAYNRHRRQLGRLGITVGKARLAFRADDCVRCGLCMTGCPYGLIYSTSQTFDSLRAAGRITYHPGLLAVSVSESDDGATVVARDIADGSTHSFDADRIYIACGTFGTTRLVLNSLRLFNKDAVIVESVQFTLPMFSARATPDPRTEAQFTLNQFNMVVDLDDDGENLSQLHFYTYNRAFIDAMPAPLRSPVAEPVLTRILERTSVALGYLPSWSSPRLHASILPTVNGELPELSVRRDGVRWSTDPALRKVMLRVARAGRWLDLYPIVPMLALAAGGKSYHWGSSFPHRDVTVHDPFSSDRLGRVGPWRRIHLVDASVFPNVPATTFGFTVMANAHRIASETVSLY